MNGIVSICQLSSGREIYVKAKAPIQIAYTDDRENYTIIKIGLINEYVPNFESLFVFNNNAIFLGTSLGRIFRSQDEGMSWQVVEDGRVSNTETAFIKAVGNQILAIFQNGTIVYSLDDGNTWREKKPIEWKLRNEALLFSGR